MSTAPAITVPAGQSRRRLSRLEGRDRRRRGARPAVRLVQFSARRCARSRPSSPRGWAATAAVGCGNGTDALALALRALGVGPGTSVVTVSHTAVATVAAIEMVGATPVLIDIEPDYYTMDPGELAEVLDRPPAGVPPIRAVIPVHLYGQPAALEPIIAACRRHGVAVIEDCAQAHGATIADRKVGTFTEVATFSFYPTKNLGALGDGGMLATQDAKLGADIAALRQYGWRTHYISDAVGVNSRLDELQAAILRVKLRHLDAQNARRRGDRRAAYDAALRGDIAGTSGTARRREPRVPPVCSARTSSGLCCKRGCARRGSGPAFTIRARCICSRRIAGAWRSGRRVAGPQRLRRGRFSACRSIRNSPTVRWRRCARRLPAPDYFGTTFWLPPGVPGGGITGIVPCDRGVGAWIPGSTDGGCNVPCCRDSLSLRCVSPSARSAGAIFSGGGDGALGGATGGVVSCGAAGCGFCANAANGSATPASRPNSSLVRFVI